MKPLASRNCKNQRTLFARRYNITDGIEFRKPTLVQLRQQCAMSYMQVAFVSGVRPCRVAWMEDGIESTFIDISLVLSVYSRVLGHSYNVEDIDGVRVREK